MPATRTSGVAHMAEALERGQAGMVNWVRFALVHLELGLGHYLAAVENALPIYKDDIPSFIGSWVLPNLIEAAVRSGNEETAREVLGRLSERAGASGTP